MDKLEILSLYKEQYESELERKNTISSQTQLRFAVIATIATLLLYMIRSVELNIPHWLILMLVALSLWNVGMLIITSNKLVKVIWGNDYVYIPFPDEIERTRNEMLDQKVLDKEPDAFIDFLLEEYSDCAGSNARTNDIRMGKLNSATTTLRNSLIPFIIIGSVFVFMDLDSSSPRKDVSVSITSVQQVKNAATALEAKHVE
ncbi:hypothetical protein [Vibrio diazotrophicus]|uniref:hypothetical protein n=1 Tax=Vibrio diazotrophicus TaxID=685 RepID=UPI000C9EC0B8|nr:hypothetical protein [Vibrio diazotrophicus]PNH80987.1 hypothetical protein C1N27_08255 [Vibrio diazotrophicus]